MVSVFVFVIVISVPIDTMDVDAHAPVGASANAGTHCGGVTAGANHSNRRHLRPEDKVALGVRGHGVPLGILVVLKRRAQSRHVSVRFSFTQARGGVFGASAYAPGSC